MGSRRRLLAESVSKLQSGVNIWGISLTVRRCCRYFLVRCWCLR